MKCPLLSISVTRDDRMEGYQEHECLKEQCAWWNNTNEMCAILQLSKSVYFMGTHIAQIEIKMPHANQFTK